ncbi:MAG: hypothetical protein JXR78_10065 [Victivallales bacterium]|nr:hypothetical protein [Victivallales bacterium]
MYEIEKKKLSLTSYIAFLVFLLMAVTFAFGRNIIEKVNLFALTLTGEVKISQAPPDAKIKKEVIEKRTKFKSAQNLMRASTKKIKQQKAPAAQAVKRKRPAENGFYVTDATTDHTSAIINVGSKQNITLNSNNWSGEDDLSFRCKLEKKHDGFQVTLAIKDNVLWAKNANVDYRNDCIEIYFDVRPDKDRGKPGYETRAVYQCTAVPFFGTPRRANTLTLRTGGQAVPTPQECVVRSNATPGGYSISVFIPFSVFKYKPGEEFNFDIGVIDYDADNNMTQMVWSGTKENYMNPTYFGRMKPAK